MKKILNITHTMWAPLISFLDYSVFNTFINRWIKRRRSTASVTAAIFMNQCFITTHILPSVVIFIATFAFPQTYNKLVLKALFFSGVIRLIATTEVCELEFVKLYTTAHLSSVPIY